MKENDYHRWNVSNENDSSEWNMSKKNDFGKWHTPKGNGFGNYIDHACHPKFLIWDSMNVYHRTNMHSLYTTLQSLHCSSLTMVSDSILLRPWLSNIVIMYNRVEMMEILFCAFCCGVKVVGKLWLMSEYLILVEN